MQAPARGNPSGRPVASPAVCRPPSDQRSTFLNFSVKRSVLPVTLFRPTS